MKKQSKGKYLNNTNNNRKHMIRNIIVILIAAIIVVIAMFISNHGNSESVKLMDTNSQILGMENDNPSGMLQDAFKENVMYEVMDIEWTGNAGIAEVKVTTPNLGAIISDAINVSINECGSENYDALLERTKEYIYARLTSEDYPTMEQIVEMDAKKTEGGYSLVSNKEFERIIAGNLEEIFVQAIMEGFVNAKED